MQSYTNNRRRSQNRGLSGRNSGYAAGGAGLAFMAPMPSTAPPLNVPTPFTPPPVPKTPPAMPMMALRGAARALPYIGWAILLWQLYNYLQMMRARSLNNGWVHKAHNSCSFQEGGVVAYNGYCSAAVPSTPAIPDCGTFSSWNNNTNPTCSAPNNYEVVYTLAEHNNPTNNRKVWVDQYYRPRAFQTDLLTSKIEPQPWDWPVDVPPLYPFAPQLEPHKTKPDTPTPQPMPTPYELVPYMRPNPYASPTEQSQRGYYFYPLQSPDVDPHFPQYAPAPAGNEVPLEYPPIVIDVHPETQTATSGSFSGRAGKYHKKTRPQRKEREAKSKSVRVMAALTRLALIGTEYDDLVKAIEKGLPKKLRLKSGASTYERTKNIYDHFDQIDADEAVKAIIANQIQDAIVGAGQAKMQAGASSHQLHLRNMMGKINPTGAFGLP